jgi:gluconolactonase
VVGKANVFAQLPGGVSGPDGLAMDIEDGLAVADPGHACVWLLDRFGVPRHRVVSCAGRTLTNVAYHGLDLFITDAETGQILKAKAPVPGRVPTHDQGAPA